MRAADARVEGIPTTVPRTPPAHALGTVTRGTTGVNRLRKCDRWMCHHPAIRSALRNAVCNTVPSVSADTCANTCTDACTDAATGAPLAIDLGYGAAPWTTVEMATRLRTHVCPTLEVVGLEIDPSRLFPPQNGVRFELGGFELSHYHPSLVRAFNVLRQYSEAEVGNAWRIMQSRLAPGGLIVEGPCNEVGQRAAWILLDNERPRSLTLAWSPTAVTTPSDVAERLPKALIHRNVPGEKIYDLLQAADAAWDATAGYATFGPIDRWRRAKNLLRENGWPVDRQRRKLQDCILTVPWEAVAPADNVLGY